MGKMKKEQTYIDGDGAATVEWNSAVQGRLRQRQCMIALMWCVSLWQGRVSICQLNIMCKIERSKAEQRSNLHK